MSSQQESKKVVFIGEDIKYWEGIQEAFRQHYASEIDSQALVMERLRDPQDPFLHKTFLSVLRLRPDILYIDFGAARFPRFFNFACLLRRCHATRSIVVVALLDRLDAEKKIISCQSIKIPFIHIKGGDKHDVVYNAFTYAFPNEAHDPAFARAYLRDYLAVFDDLRVHYMERDRVRVEGDVHWRAGDEVELDWNMDDNILFSNRFRVLQVGQRDHFFDYQYVYDLGYHYVDPMSERKQNQLIRRLDDPYAKLAAYDEAELELAQEEDENQMSGLLVLSDEEERPSSDHQEEVEAEFFYREVDRSLDRVLAEERPQVASKEVYDHDKLRPKKELLKVIKRRLLNWIKIQNLNQRVKYSKCLIIDKSMQSLLQFERDLDQYPFEIRFQTHLEQVEEDIARYRPTMIAFEYEPLPADRNLQQNPLSFNNVEALKAMMDYIKSDFEYNPFVIIFNNPTFETQKCRDAFEYAQILVIPERLNIKTIESMAGVYHRNYEKKLLSLGRKKVAELQARDPQRFAKLTPKEVMDQKLYISEGSDLATMRLEKKVLLNSMTESELTFETTEKIDLYKTFRLQVPLPMLITIVPKRATGPFAQRENVYRALIHGVSEKDKQKIRRFVNALFEQQKGKKEAPVAGVLNDFMEKIEGEES